jgi:hypothetical protein
MDVISFVLFSFRRRYILRWVLAGIVFPVPVLDFLSLGYLWRTSGLSMVGGLGLPTWERKGELGREGARLLYITILYEALPSFLCSLAFLLFQIKSLVTDFAGYVMAALAIIAFLLCSFFLPFAFCAYVEAMELRKAFDFEKIFGAVKEVLPPYILGYAVFLCAAYVTYRLVHVPIIGVVLLLTLPFYVLLVSTYYFTQLFRRTSLWSGEHHRDLR